MKKNYFDVKIPEDKDPEDYSYVERRAEILRVIMKAGHPRAIPQRKFCEKYDVAQGTISNDLDKIADSLDQQDKKDSAMMTLAVFQNSIRELQNQGQYYKAAKVVDMLNDWMFKTGKLEKEPERYEIDNITAEDMNELYNETKRKEDGDTEESIE